MPGEARELDGRLGGAVDVIARAERLESLREQLVPGSVGLNACTAGLDEEPRAIRIVLGPNRERGTVKTGGGGVGGQCEGAVASRAECQTGAVREIGIVLPCGTRVLESALGVVS